MQDWQFCNIIVLLFVFLGKIISWLCNQYEEADADICCFFLDTKILTLVISCNVNIVSVSTNQYCFTANLQYYNSNIIYFIYFQFKNKRYKIGSLFLWLFLGTAAYIFVIGHTSFLTYVRMSFYSFPAQ